MESQKLSDLLAGANNNTPEESLDPEALYKRALQALDAMDVKTAALLLKTASDMGYADASCELGLLFSLNDEKGSAEFHRIGAEQGSRISQYYYGILAFKKGDYEEAAKWLQKSVEQGFYPAMLNLGILYDQGMGVEKDYVKALQLFRKVADLQDFREQISVILRYYSDKLFTSIPSMAQFNLGLAYLNGYGVEKNLEEAKKWLRRSADGGYEEAINRLREIEEEEEGNEHSPYPSSRESVVKKALDGMAQSHESPELPYAGRIKRSTPRFIIRSLLFLIGVAAVLLVRRMDQMSYQPISEEEAITLAQEVTVTIPDQEFRILNSQDKKKLKVGTKVKVIGVYKQKLNKGNSPRVYWTNQNYLVEFADGTRGYGPLMETAIGQRTVLPDGDTAVITAVKKLKKAPIIQETGKESRFEYAYTLEGHEGQYALEDLHIHFPQRVAYLGEGLREEKYLVANDTTDVDMSFWQGTKKFFLYDIRPITKKSGYFLFPKYQIWNEFLLQRWFRSLLIFLAYLLEIFLIIKFFGNISNLKDNIHGAFWFPKYYRRAKQGDPDACFEVGDSCYLGYAYYGVREENIGQAILWFRKAAEQGQSDACARLGNIYETGESVAKDQIEAYKWYEKGHHNNETCKEGMNRIIDQNVGALAYNDGIEAQNNGDMGKAFSDFKLGAEHGYAEAQHALARCYFNGTGTAKNTSEAVVWFRKAAEQDLSGAQLMLGICYLQGIGIAADQEEGISWLKMAARNGEKQAVNLLNSLNISSY